MTGVISEIGVPINYENTDLLRLSIRPVGYFKDSIVVTSGKGTEKSPYLINQIGRFNNEEKEKEK